MISFSSKGSDDLESQVTNSVVKVERGMAPLQTLDWDTGGMAQVTNASVGD